MSVQIPLDSLDASQIKLVHKLLFLQPKPDFLGFSSRNPFMTPVAKDPILFYCENKHRNDILLPYAFANKLLGYNHNATHSYTKASFSFTSQLRPEQVEVTEKALKLFLTFGSVILGCHPGFGKCLAPGTLVLLPDGTSKPVELLQPNDKIQGDDGTVRNILSVSSGEDTMYDIITEDGTTFTVNSHHILTLYDGNSIIDIPLLHYLNLNKSFQAVYIPVDYPLDSSTSAGDAYIFGLNLKDGEEIPTRYKINTFEIRAAFLRGIMKNSNSFSKTYPILATIAKSIGFKVSNDYVKEGPLGEPSYVNFKIVKKEVGKYHGFTLDGNGRFLLDSYLVTHNTVVSSYLASQADGIVLVLYHRTILGDQWYKTFEQFTDAEIWLVDKHDPPSSCNVILSMDTTIFNIPPEILKQVKCLIIDEAHAFCVPSRVSCLLATQPLFVVACSATLDTRRDGLQEMIYAMCGKNMVIKESTKPFDVYKVLTGIELELSKNRAGMTNWAQLVKDLSEHPLRNKFILDLIVQNPEHKIIVLTWTKAHVDYLYNHLLERDVEVDYLCGNKKKYNDSQVLIGTISKIGTGFDEATSCHNFRGRKSNMMIICGSVKNQGGLEQFVGRVFRADYPTIFHLVDQDRIAKSHWRSCEQWYLSRNGSIVEFAISLDPSELDSNSRVTIELIQEKEEDPAILHLHKIREKRGLGKLDKDKLV